MKALKQGHVEVLRSDFVRAMQRFHSVYPKESFHSFVSTDKYDFVTRQNIYILNEGQAKIIEMLLSPYWMPLLRAMIANQR